MAIAHDKSSRPKSNNSPSISIVPHTAWTDDELSRTDLRVLLAISAHCRKTDREAWPSQSTIADLLSITRESVSRSVSNLEKRGHLRVERVFGDRGEQRSNRYFVPLDGINGSDQSDTPPVSNPSHPLYQTSHPPLSSVDTPPVITTITHNRERLTENVEQETLNIKPLPLSKSKQEIITPDRAVFDDCRKRLTPKGKERLTLAKAWTNWQALTKTHGTDLVVAAFNHWNDSQDCQKEGGRFQGDLAIWLRDKASNIIELLNEGTIHDFNANHHNHASQLSGQGNRAQGSNSTGTDDGLFGYLMGELSKTERP